MASETVSSETYRPTADSQNAGARLERASSPAVEMTTLQQPSHPTTSSDQSKSGDLQARQQLPSSHSTTVSSDPTIATGTGVTPATVTTQVARGDLETGSAVLITLLLITGARHPYRIDEKYLRQRGVIVDRMDPYNVSIYTLKELILRDWREEWQPKPSAPSAIRLIYFGRLLDDKQALRDCRFQTGTANVVHMTIKPQDMLDDDEGKPGKGSSKYHDGEGTVGCRCIVL